MEVMSSIDLDSLTSEQRQKALRAVNIIKLNRRGKLKGMMYADGAPHFKFLPREEVKLPAITLEVLLSIMVIYAYEDRKVAISAYLVRTYIETFLKISL